MYKSTVKKPEQALVYITDCILASIQHMAMLKSRNKADFERQIAIAQTSIDWMLQMDIDPRGSLAETVLRKGGEVSSWIAPQTTKRSRDKTLEKAYFMAEPALK